MKNVYKWEILYANLQPKKMWKCFARMMLYKPLGWVELANLDIFFIFAIYVNLNFLIIIIQTFYWPIVLQNI